LIGYDEVVTSTELKHRLVKLGYTDDNARQVIRRVFGQDPAFWRSEALQLPGGIRLYARREFHRRREFYGQIGRILGEHRPGLARCLSKLATVGVLNRVQACKLLASPTQPGPSRAYPHFDSELKALRELGVQVIREGTAFEYLLGAGRKPNDLSEQLASDAVTLLRKESLLARILIERYRRQNLVSWGGAEFPERDKHSVVFNDQLFTARGFCHLGPIRRLVEVADGTRSVATPVLFDVHAGRCTPADVESFLERAERATCRGPRRHPWLGVIAAREFAQPAWKLARSRGLITVNFRQMFGDEALEAMARVEQVIEAFQHDADPDAGRESFLSFASSLEELKANPVVVDLRSIGFELLTGMGLRSKGFERVKFGLLVPYKDTVRDVDAYGELGDDAWLVECKAYHSKKMITPDDVSKFVTETVPSFVKWWTQVNGRPLERCHAHIWTTGRVGSEAKRKLERTKLHRSVDGKLLGPDDILALLPSGIRERCTKMLASIAMTDEVGDDEAGEGADVATPEEDFDEPVIQGVG
jgi:hypothetical protein